MYKAAVALPATALAIPTTLPGISSTKPPCAFVITKMTSASSRRILLSKTTARNSILPMFANSTIGWCIAWKSGVSNRKSRPGITWYPSSRAKFIRTMILAKAKRLLWTGCSLAIPISARSIPLSEIPMEILFKEAVFSIATTRTDCGPFTFRITTAPAMTICKIPNGPPWVQAAPPRPPTIHFEGRTAQIPSCTARNFKTRVWTTCFYSWKRPHKAARQRLCPRDHRWKHIIWHGSVW